MSLDVRQLLSHAELNGFPYHELFISHRVEVAAARWHLLTETNRALREIRAARDREQALREAEGRDEAPRPAERRQDVAPPRRLALLGLVRRFSTEKRGT